MILLLCLCLQSWLRSRWHLPSLLCSYWRLLLFLLFRLVWSSSDVELLLILSSDIDDTVCGGVPTGRAPMREQALAGCDNVAKRIHQATVLLNIVIIWAQGWYFVVGLLNLLILEWKIVPSPLTSWGSRPWSSVVCSVFFTILLLSLIWSTPTLRHLSRTIHKHMRWL